MLLDTNQNYYSIFSVCRYLHKFNFLLPLSSFIFNYLLLFLQKFDYHFYDNLHKKLFINDYLRHKIIINSFFFDNLQNKAFFFWVWKLTLNDRWKFWTLTFLYGAVFLWHHSKRPSLAVISSTEISWMANRKMMVQIIPSVIFRLPSTISAKKIKQIWNEVWEKISKTLAIVRE